MHHRRSIRGEATHGGNPTSLVRPGACVDRHPDAQRWASEITGVVLAIAAAILGGWAVPLVAGVLLVAFVAVYDKAHTFSDVIGGMILGGVMVSLGAAVLGATHYTRRDAAVAPVNDPSPPYT